MKKDKLEKVVILVLFKYGMAIIKTSWEKVKEDNGKLHFNVYVYNVQDGIVIDYATGESKLARR